MLTKLAIAFSALAAAGATGLAFFMTDPSTPDTPIASVFEQGEDFQFEPPAPGSYPLHRIKSAPDGTVIDIAGKTHTLHDLTKGKISLVSFVYLNCGDINGCPLAMATLFDIHDTSIKVPGLREDVQLVTISFDPERDTVEAIDSFAYPITSDKSAKDKIEWHVLTTSGSDALQPILDGYGQVVDRESRFSSISQGLIHTRLLLTGFASLFPITGRIGM